MGESHSEEGRPIGAQSRVLSAESYTTPTEAGTIIKINVPAGFDFIRRGKSLLKSIESAANLFTERNEKE